MQSILKQQSIDYGYDPANVLTARMGLMDGDYPSDEARKLFFDRLVREMRSNPEFEAVALTTQKLARAVKAAFAAEGVTVQQFNEAAGGQVVFHMHVHVMPRFEGVALRPHTGAMEKTEVLANNAEKIREALKAL